MAETTENRLRRLHMRSWRRGMKEMDLILGHFADDTLQSLSAEELDLYERLLGENDQDLYLWVTALIGSGPLRDDRGPAQLAPLLQRIARHASGRLGRSQV
ncbi:succinate dehydrogenase assembly factor 2 [Paracoccus sp. (in: a-proteobacteria)]|uniref:succinate dehydrogenase assembly factor 2 n=1 Tax=Paracoccus sp. TaxID=267 RepID=UPI00396CBA8E